MPDEDNNILKYNLLEKYIRVRTCRHRVFT